MKKIAVITGTSTGLGLEASVLFAKNNFKVYATMRNLEKSQALKQRIEDENLDIDILQLDVTSTLSVNSAIEEVIKRSGKIDLLINNAGAGFAKTTEQITEDEMEWITDLNYYGVVRGTKAVLPIMRKQNSGHIINISSVGGLVGQPFNELYCAAKFAVEGYTESLASYVTKAFNINFTIVEPGGISSEFMKSAVAKTMIDGKMPLDEYTPIFDSYVAGARERASNNVKDVYQTPEQVAEVILNVAQQDHPPVRIRTSKWAEDFCILKTQADPDGTILRDRINEDLL
ncbi:MAG: SDR family oxidoreductase [Hyphomicrobiales bacterium]